MRLVRVALALAVVAAVLVPGPAGAEGKMKLLGVDPANDGPPALDLTALQVGRTGADLEIRLGVNNMLPGIGGYPTLPGIQWAFDSGKRTFVAEAYVNNSRPAFLLFELKGDTYENLGDIEGTYDWSDGYIKMLVPLKMIQAKTGSVISGAGEQGSPDADAHVHLLATTYVADTLSSTKDFVVP